MGVFLFSFFFFGWCSVFLAHEGWGQNKRSQRKIYSERRSTEKETATSTDRGNPVKNNANRRSIGKA